MRDDNEQITSTKPEADSRLNVKEHIEITPGVCGGKPRIAGHRIRVMDIVIWHKHQGWSPNEIVAHFRQLTLAAVSAALSYYRKHSEEIEADIRHTEEVEAEARERHPSRLKGKMEAEPREVLS
jgi:uncharacterized protein (DUF433 family)